MSLAGAPSNRVSTALSATRLNGNLDSKEAGDAPLCSSPWSALHSAPTIVCGSRPSTQGCREYGEPRFITLGQLKGRTVVIAHTPRGENTRIISMRKANSREQKNYQERLEASRRDEG